ncbi:hypothetical protein [Brevibacterium sp. SMBL_HHYL_HB1]|nr:hypothetical protein [Brevibacterium sp. SMBL_HHYL_HB1]QUL78194.1 hypothetical protein IG171_12060 [Brevibacterium sp. SMBL_HHYL_HB1]
MTRYQHDVQRRFALAQQLLDSFPVLFIHHTVEVLTESGYDVTGLQVR